jgi:flagellar hook protein FlgE
MSVISTMATAISGLEANAQELSVISDNIVNANTTAYKASRGEFQSVLAQDLFATSSELGRGVNMAGITSLFSQGPITKTDRSTDVAINGNGFFVLKGDFRGLSYTRDGSFRFDKDGWLTTLNGQRVQAYAASNDNRITGKLGDIRIPYNSIPAKATDRIDMHINLDARLPVSKAFDPAHPDDSAQFNASVQIFDSVGNAHPVGVYFNKTADSTWSWHAMTDGGEIAGGTPGKPEMIAKGELKFDPHGKLSNVEQNILNTSFSNGAIADQDLKFDFGREENVDGEGNVLDRTTQFGSKNAIFRSSQDGFAAGYLADTNIDTDGTITGIYTNGQNRLLGQLAIARFDAPERLTKAGQNQYRETVYSGQAAIGSPNSNGRGSVNPKSLESSNVDIAKEFVDMIKAQRGFQASAKSITTANEMLDEVINLRRN